jgi:oligoendopeptidase F
MRRIISLILVLAMILPITACNQTKELTISNVSTDTVSPTEAVSPANTVAPTEAANPSIAATPTEAASLTNSTDPTDTSSPTINEASQKISWDISSIYPDDAAVELEYSRIATQINAIATLRGKLSTVDGVISYYKGIDEANRLLRRMSSYVSLQQYKDHSDQAAKEQYIRMSDLAGKLFVDTAFALPELLANSENFLDMVAEDPRMKPYLTWFNRDRAMRAHILPESEERLLYPIYQVQDSAYFQYLAIADNILTVQNNLFPNGPERPEDGSTKEKLQENQLAYYNAKMQPYHQYRNQLAFIMHKYYKALAQIAASHKYGSALEASLTPEGTPISVYYDVIAAANQARPLLDRYFALLKKAFGVTTLYSFETYTSIVKDPGTDYSYLDAQKLVKEALAPLGEDYAKRLDRMLSADAIDVYPAKNKSTGGFTVFVPGMHPYILLNYTGDLYSVSALIHELGHAVHMLYAQDQESYYNQNVSNLSTEVASTLNQLLLSDYLMKHAKTEEERQYYAAQQMNTLYVTFFIQILNAQFQEEAAREVERGGLLTADRLDELWTQTVKKCFGEAYTLTDSDAGEWARNSFFYNDFYVYQYAVGIAAACNIADRIQSGDKNAVEDYLAFLKAGYSGNIVELLNIAGVDIKNGDYISAFTARFDRLITEFEKIYE